MLTLNFRTPTRAYAFKAISVQEVSRQGQVAMASENSDFGIEEFAGLMFMVGKMHLDERIKADKK